MATMSPRTEQLVLTFLRTYGQGHGTVGRGIDCIVAVGCDGGVMLCASSAFSGGSVGARTTRQAVASAPAGPLRLSGGTPGRASTSRVRRGQR